MLFSASTSPCAILPYLLSALSIRCHVASIAVPKNSGLTQVKVLFDSTNQNHRDVKYHPEQPLRITACVNALQEYNAKGLAKESGVDLHIIDFANIPIGKGENTEHIPITDDELAHARSMLVKSHSEEYVMTFENRCRSSRQKRINDGKPPLGFIGYVDDDTFLTTETYDVCLRATAAWIRCVDSVTKETFTTAMALTRPPGHHATKTLSNGFCIFNFAAAAAIHAVELGLKVSILDWDIHYGQGVSNIVQHIPETRYVSIHQTSAFPYQGEKFEISGACANILTIPVPPLTGWQNGYQEVFEEKALPFLHTPGSENDSKVSWEPDIILVCAGYDALLSDELASSSLTAEDYGTMTRTLRNKIGHTILSDESKNTSKLLFGLEGGYQLRKDVKGGNLADAVVETVHALGFHPEMYLGCNKSQQMK